MLKQNTSIYSKSYRDEVIMLKNFCIILSNTCIIPIEFLIENLNPPLMLFTDKQLHVLTFVGIRIW